MAKHKNQAAKYPRKAIYCVTSDEPGESARLYAGLISSPELAGVRIINGIEADNLTENLDVPALMEVLRDQGRAVNEGDMGQAERMLMAQAVSLQYIFARMAERAATQASAPVMESLFRVALRAQNQCRMTLETLSDIKNPPVVYAKQANISNGHQQINNGISAHTRQTENAPTQLLEMILPSFSGHLVCE